MSMIDQRRQARPATRPAAPRQSAAQMAGVRRAPARGRAPRRGGWLAVPDHRYTALKWALLAALVVFAVLVTRTNAARDVDFSAIRAGIDAAPGLEALDRLDENAAQDRLGIAPEGCEGWLMYGSEDVMNVSELLVAKGDAAALDRLEAAARARVEIQLDVFRSYGVDQKQLLEGATLTRRGRYLFYAVGDASGVWEDAFLSAIR